MMTKFHGTEASISKPATFQLQLFADLQLKETRPLARKSMLVTGRDSCCDWRYEHPDLLPQHFCITEDKGHFFVTAFHPDTLLDHTAMVPDHAYLLSPGKTISIGAFQIQLSQHENPRLATELPTTEARESLEPLFTNHTPGIGIPEPVSEAVHHQVKKWRDTMIALCLLLPLTSYLMSITTHNLSISTSSVNHPLETPTIPSAKPLPAATFSVAESHQSSDPMLVNPSRSDALTHKHQTMLITPAPISDSVSRKPYGLAAPNQWSNHYNATIGAAARLNNLDPALIKAVIHAESGFNLFAVSVEGAQGLMQIMPATAAELALDDAFHPGNNILSGSKLLRRLLDKYRQDISLALAAYNAGERAVDKYQGIPPYKETQLYIEKVKELRLKYQTNQAERLSARRAN